MWAKNMWECVPHLMQQNEIPMKGYKISKVEHFTITQLDKKKVDEHED